MTRRAIDLPDGRTAVVHDTGPQGGDPDRPALVWHHGSPQTGALLAPVLEAAADRGLRVVSPARAGYGGAARLPGRSVADAARDTSQVLDVLGVRRCWLVGASGGGPHALALAALRPDLAAGVVTLAGIAPYDGTEAWFTGMADDGALRAALGGADARARYEETATFDESTFIAADHAALDGPWRALGEDAQAAGEQWPGGLVDDDVAFVRPWGFDLRAVSARVLVVQGDADRVVPAHHGARLVAGLPAAEPWQRPGDGHISVLTTLPDALDRLR